ncbi:hypothetical protein N7468_000567 [Penicillium chermesinum]|uniref:Uncharacterized protein n=1 Tax=Penicillium chermesinum TaxID=63820 RepID=A0A9W9PKJ8_9EURO|nr:uncharacterized protein N7468_000567 [Penicillium chermesinum]KAJ5249116.1 hypothetical protein N7468_000567 [Penicillium chermesinum]
MGVRWGDHWVRFRHETHMQRTDSLHRVVTEYDWLVSIYLRPRSLALLLGLAGRNGEADFQFAPRPRIGLCEMLTRPPLIHLS